MKKLLFLSMIIPTLSYSQVQLGAEVGLNVSETSPVIGINTGYRIPYSECEHQWWRGLFVKAGYTSYSSLYTMIGKSIFIGESDGIDVGIAYYYDKINSEQKSTNIITPMYSLNIWKNTIIGELGIGLKYTNVPIMTFTYVFNVGY